MGQTVAQIGATIEPTGEKYLGYEVYKRAWGSAIYVKPTTFESLTNDLDFIDFVDNVTSHH